MKSMCIPLSSPDYSRTPSPDTMGKERIHLRAGWWYPIMVRLPLVIWITRSLAGIEKVYDRVSEDRGCLATFDGDKWEVIERRQYTEVTGPRGIHPTAGGSDDPVWAIGWDKRSLRLQVMEDGKFHLFLLPKGCLNNDAAHGWFTEWPRIRDVGQKDLLMDMHGMFFQFPRNFSSTNSGGIEPIGSHIRYLPDFCFEWQGGFGYR